MPVNLQKSIIIFFIVAMYEPFFFINAAAEKFCFYVSFSRYRFNSYLSINTQYIAPKYIKIKMNIVRMYRI